MPTDWELQNLPIVELTAPSWDPCDVHLPNHQPTADARYIASVASISESANVLSQISTSLDFHQLSALYSSAVLVSPAPASGTVNDPSSHNLRIAAAVSSERHSSLSPENLSRKWNIGIGTVKRTLQVTTQNGIRTALHPLQR